MIRTFDNGVADFYYLEPGPDIGSMKDYAILAEDPISKLGF